MSSSDYISPDEAKTLYGLFCERVKRSADKEAYGYFDNENQSWLSLSWQQVADSVHLWQQALQQENLRKGDRVALNLRNSKEWIFFDLAALSLGLVVVPLYPDDRPDNVAYILQDADVRLLLVNSARQWGPYYLKSIASDESLFSMRNPRKRICHIPSCTNGWMWLIPKLLSPRPHRIRWHRLFILQVLPAVQKA